MVYSQRSLTLSLLLASIRSGLYKSKRGFPKRLANTILNERTANGGANVKLEPISFEAIAPGLRVQLESESHPFRAAPSGHWADKSTHTHVWLQPESGWIGAGGSMITHIQPHNFYPQIHDTQKTRTQRRPNRTSTVMKLHAVLSIFILWSHFCGCFAVVAPRSCENIEFVIEWCVLWDACAIYV